MDFKNIINTSSYDFLRNDINLKDRIILLVVGGSYGYGLNVETSDIDLRGISVERKEVLLGLFSVLLFQFHFLNLSILPLLKLCFPNNPFCPCSKYLNLKTTQKTLHFQRYIQLHLLLSNEEGTWVVNICSIL